MGQCHKCQLTPWDDGFINIKIMSFICTVTVHDSWHDIVISWFQWSFDCESCWCTYVAIYFYSLGPTHYWISFARQWLWITWSCVRVRGSHRFITSLIYNTTVECSKRRSILPRLKLSCIYIVAYRYSEHFGWKRNWQKSTQTQFFGIWHHLKRPGPPSPLSRFFWYNLHWLQGSSFLDQNWQKFANWQHKMFTDIVYIV